MAGVVAGVVVDELLGWSVWKKLVIVVVVGLRWVFFFVFLVLFVDFEMTPINKLIACFECVEPTLPRTYFHMTHCFFLYRNQDILC